MYITYMYILWYNHPCVVHCQEFFVPLITDHEIVQCFHPCYPLLWHCRVHPWECCVFQYDGCYSDKVLLHVIQSLNIHGRHAVHLQLGRCCLGGPVLACLYNLACLLHVVPEGSDHVAWRDSVISALYVFVSHGLLFSKLYIWDHGHNTTVAMHEQQVTYLWMTGKQCEHGECKQAPDYATYCIHVFHLELMATMVF